MYNRRMTDKLSILTWTISTVIIIGFGLTLMGCGTDHDVNVNGGTDHKAAATVEIIKECDQAVIRVCKNSSFDSDELLECIRYACGFDLEVRGIDDLEVPQLPTNINGTY